LSLRAYSLFVIAGSPSRVGEPRRTSRNPIFIFCHSRPSRRSVAEADAGGPPAGRAGNP